MLKSLPVDERPSDPSRHSELIGIWIGYVESEATTTERILSNVQAGRYNFKPEQLEAE